MAENKNDSRKKFEQARSGLVQNIEQRKALLNQQRLEMGAIARQNQTIKQAADIAAQTTGQQELGASTEATLRKYGRPSVSKKSEIVTKNPNIIVNNTVTNYNGGVGPTPGRPLVVNSPGQKDGGIAKFKAWLSGVFAKQAEDNSKREREFIKQDGYLSRTSSKLMKRLETFGSSIAEQMNPKRIAAAMGSQMKTLLFLFGAFFLAANWTKILDGIGKITDSIKRVADYFTGKNNETPKFIVTITKLLGGNEKDGVIGSFRNLFSATTDAIKDFFKKEWEIRSEAVRQVKMPTLADTKGDFIGILSRIGDYLVDVLTCLTTGSKGVSKSISRTIRTGVDTATNEKTATGAWVNNRSKYTNRYKYNVWLGDAASAMGGNTMISGDVENNYLTNNTGASVRQAKNISALIRDNKKANVAGVMTGMERLKNTAVRKGSVVVPSDFFNSFSYLGVPASSLESLTRNSKVGKYKYVIAEKTEDDYNLEGLATGKNLVNDMLRNKVYDMAGMGFIDRGVANLTGLGRGYSKTEKSLAYTGIGLPIAVASNWIRNRNPVVQGILTEGIDKKLTSSQVLKMVPIDDPRPAQEINTPSGKRTVFEMLEISPNQIKDLENLIRSRTGNKDFEFSTNSEGSMVSLGKAIQDSLSRRGHKNVSLDYEVSAYDKMRELENFEKNANKEYKEKHFGENTILGRTGKAWNELGGDIKDFGTGIYNNVSGYVNTWVDTGKSFWNGGGSRDRKMSSSWDLKMNGKKTITGSNKFVKKSSQEVKRRVAYCMSRLINAGLSPGAAAGVVGNLLNEGLAVTKYSLDHEYPDNSGPSAGIAGFHSYYNGSKGELDNLKAYARSRNRRHGDLDVQVDYLINCGYPAKVLSLIKKRTDGMDEASAAEEAAYIWGHEYERFAGFRNGKTYSKYQQRIATALSVLEHFSDAPSGTTEKIDIAMPYQVSAGDGSAEDINIHSSISTSSLGSSSGPLSSSSPITPAAFRSFTPPTNYQEVSLSSNINSVNLGGSLKDGLNLMRDVSLDELSRFGGGNSGKRVIKKIIIHCTESAYGADLTARDVDQMHKARGWRGIGYHYLIRLNGVIEKGRPDSEIGAHTVGYNKESIGVCYVGGLGPGGVKDPADTRTPAQKESLRRLVSWLLKKYPGATVHGHYEFANKACPCFDVSAEFGPNAKKEDEGLGDVEASGPTKTAITKEGAWEKSVLWFKNAEDLYKKIKGGTATDADVVSLMGGMKSLWVNKEMDLIAGKNFSDEERKAAIAKIDSVKDVKTFLESMKQGAESQVGTAKDLKGNLNFIEKSMGVGKAADALVEKTEKRLDDINKTLDKIEKKEEPEKKKEAWEIELDKLAGADAKTNWERLKEKTKESHSIWGDLAELDTNETAKSRRMRKLVGPEKWSEFREKQLEDLRGIIGKNYKSIKLLAEKGDGNAKNILNLYSAAAKNPYSNAIEKLETALFSLRTNGVSGIVGDLRTYRQGAANYAIENFSNNLSDLASPNNIEKLNYLGFTKEEIDEWSDSEEGSVEKYNRTYGLLGFDPNKDLKEKKDSIVVDPTKYGSGFRVLRTEDEAKADPAANRYRALQEAAKKGSSATINEVEKLLDNLRDRLDPQRDLADFYARETKVVFSTTITYSYSGDLSLACSRRDEIRKIKSNLKPGMSVDDIMQTENRVKETVLADYNNILGRLKRAELNKKSDITKRNQFLNKTKICLEKVNKLEKSGESLDNLISYGAFEKIYEAPTYQSKNGTVFSGNYSSFGGEVGRDANSKATKANKELQKKLLELRNKLSYYTSGGWKSLKAKLEYATNSKKDKVPGYALEYTWHPGWWKYRYAPETNTSSSPKRWNQLFELIDLLEKIEKWKNSDRATKKKMLLDVGTEEKTAEGVLDLGDSALGLFMRNVGETGETLQETLDKNNLNLSETRGLSPSVNKKTGELELERDKNGNIIDSRYISAFNNGQLDETGRTKVTLFDGDRAGKEVYATEKEYSEYLEADETKRQKMYEDWINKVKESKKTYNLNAFKYLGSDVNGKEIGIRLVKLQDGSFVQILDSDYEEFKKVINDSKLFNDGMFTGDGLKKVNEFLNNYTKATTGKLKYFTKDESGNWVETDEDTVFGNNLNYKVGKYGEEKIPGVDEEELGIVNKNAWNKLTPAQKKMYAMIHGGAKKGGLLNKNNPAQQQEEEKKAKAEEVKASFKKVMESQVDIATGTQELVAAAAGSVEKTATQTEEIKKAVENVTGELNTLLTKLNQTDDHLVTAYGDHSKAIESLLGLHQQGL